MPKNKNTMELTETMQRILLFLLTTFMFVSLIQVIAKSLEISRKPFEGKPVEIQTIHEKYILGLNVIMVLYIYFLVLCYLMIDYIEGTSIFEWVFIVVNFVLAFSMMVIASDTRKKLSDLNELGEYKDYLKVVDGLIAVSTILLVVMLLWVGLKYMKSKKEKQLTSNWNQLKANVKK